MIVIALIENKDIMISDFNLQLTHERVMIQKGLNCDNKK
jgi:hypothetical protein